MTQNGDGPKPQDAADMQKASQHMQNTEDLKAVDADRLSAASKEKLGAAIKGETERAQKEAASASAHAEKEQAAQRSQSERSSAAKSVESARHAMDKASEQGREAFNKSASEATAKSDLAKQAEAAKKIQKDASHSKTQGLKR